MAGKKAADQPKGKKPYQLWDVKISTDEKGKPKIDKLKVVRDINISDDEAASLNTGIEYGGNNFAQMAYPNPDYVAPKKQDDAE